MTRKLLPIFAANMTAYQDAIDDLCGLNRTTCAKRAAMSKGQWSDMLHGKIPSPRIWTAARVADVLGVTLDDLVTTDPEKRAAAIRRAVDLHQAARLRAKGKLKAASH